MRTAHAYWRRIASLICATAGILVFAAPTAAYSIDAVNSFHEDAWNNYTYGVKLCALSNFDDPNGGWNFLDNQKHIRLEAAVSKYNNLGRELHMYFVNTACANLSSTDNHISIGWSDSGCLGNCSAWHTNLYTLGYETCGFNHCRTWSQIEFVNNEYLANGYSWDMNAGTSVDFHKIDFQGVATHELGHALGMNHVTSPDDAIMCSDFPFDFEVSACDASDSWYGNETGGDDAQRWLADDDKAGIANLYPLFFP